MKSPASKLGLWRYDPVQFVRDNFGVEPDEWQKDFLIAYNENRRIAAKACKGPGKTAVLAWCAWHFLATRDNAKIAATSISGDNLRDGLWTEMAKWQAKSEFLSATFTWTKTRIYNNDHHKTWYMSARQWSKSANAQSQADTLAGLHADNIMFLIDEAGGVPDAVMAAAEAVMANEGSDAKILICGNPTHLSGPLYRACTSEASLWTLIEITGDPNHPKRSPRISKQWAEEQIKKYGIDNPWVLVNVFGKFPPASLNALLGPDDFEEAFNRHVAKDAYQHAGRVLGVDVARQGDDTTVIAPRQGIVAFKPKIMRVHDTVQIAGHVARAINKFKPDVVNIDATGGWGYGVIDTLRTWGYECNDIQFAGKAFDIQYANKRAEMAFEFAKWIKAGGCLPPVHELREEGTAVTYFFNKKDQFQIVDKDLIKEELGRSPDLFDAYALTFAIPVVKKDPLAHLRQPEDYNPMGYQDHAQQHSVDDFNPLG